MNKRRLIKLAKSFSSDMFVTDECGKLTIWRTLPIYEASKLCEDYDFYYAGRGRQFVASLTSDLTLSTGSVDWGYEPFWQILRLCDTRWENSHYESMLKKRDEAELSKKKQKQEMFEAKADEAYHYTVKALNKNLSTKEMEKYGN